MAYWVLPFNCVPGLRVDYRKSKNLEGLKRFLLCEIEFLKVFQRRIQDFYEEFQGMIELVFGALDTENKGFVTPYQFASFFCNNFIKVEDSLIFRVFRRFDSNNDGVITKAEFLSLFENQKTQKPENLIESTSKVLIKNTELSQSVKNFSKTKPKQKILINFQEKIDKKCEAELKVFSKSIIESEKLLEEQKKELALTQENLCFKGVKYLNSTRLRVDYTVESVFQLFDKKRKKKVSKNDFEAVLQELGIKTTQKLISIIFSHYDRNLDGLLTFFDFLNIFMPKKMTYA